GMFPFDFHSAIDMIWHYNSTPDKTYPDDSTKRTFNGNLDHGLTQPDLDNMLNTKVSTMINQAIETMMKNISKRDK
ncbi:MAG: hypothetical protein GY940_45435, partial [bacterium]|nr:hypothetical protein [bacterium]